VAFLGSALALQDNGLEFFEDDELLVRVVDLGVSLLFTYQETGFLEALQLTLNVTSVLFDKFCQATHMRLKVWVLSINHNNLAANSAGDEDV